MLVTLSGIVMLVRLLQLKKVCSPMLVTPSGIVMLVRSLQSEKASSPMLVTPFGIVMLVSPVQPKKAESPMLVTLPSAGITLFLQPAMRIPSAVCITQFPAE